MACATGNPTSQTDAPTLPVRLSALMNCATALLSPLSTAIIHFTSLLPAYHEEILLYSGAPSVAEVPTSTKLTPAPVRIGFAPSIRGWMFPVPGVAMIPATWSPDFDALLEDRLPDRGARGEVVLADVGHPVVLRTRRDVGVVRDHGNAGAQRRCRRVR